MTDNNSPGAQSAFDARHDLGAALFFAVWSATGWYAVYGDSYLWSNFGADPGPSLMPAIVLTLLSISSFVMLVGAVSRLRSAGLPRRRSGIFTHLLYPLLFLASLVALVPLMEAFGFVPAAALFAVGWMFGLRDRTSKRSLKHSLVEVTLATIIGVGIIYYVFVRVIHVPLP